jgi:hypothetical protein
MSASASKADWENAYPMIAVMLSFDYNFPSHLQ